MTDKKLNLLSLEKRVKKLEAKLLLEKSQTEKPPCEHFWKKLITNKEYSGTVGYYFTVVPQCVKCNFVDGSRENTVLAGSEGDPQVVPLQVDVDKILKRAQKKYKKGTLVWIKISPSGFSLDEPFINEVEEVCLGISGDIRVVMIDDEDYPIEGVRKIK